MLMTLRFYDFFDTQEFFSDDFFQYFRNWLSVKTSGSMIPSHTFLFRPGHMTFSRSRKDAPAQRRLGVCAREPNARDIGCLHTLLGQLEVDCLNQLGINSAEQGVARHAGHTRAGRAALPCAAPQHRETFGATVGARLCGTYRMWERRAGSGGVHRCFACAASILSLYLPPGCVSRVTGCIGLHTRQTHMRLPPCASREVDASVEVANVYAHSLGEGSCWRAQRRFL